MAIRHMDFPSGQLGLYGTDQTLMTNGLWAEVSGGVAIVDDPDPNISGNVLRLMDNDRLVRFVLPSFQNTVGMANRIWFSFLPVSSITSPRIHQYRDSLNNNIITILVNTTGRIEVRSGDFNGTLLGTSAAPVIVANAWQHMESRVFFNASTGTVEVRVEGIPVINLTGINTGSAACAQVVHSSPQSGVNEPSLYIKDIIYWDTVGSVANDFQGSRQVRRLTPNGDVSFNWQASTGLTGFNLIDESPPNDDADYIFAGDPPPAASTFDMTDLPVDVTSISSLYVVVRSRKTDGGDGNLQVGLISGVSTALGVDRPITTSYTYWTDVFEVDPATSSPWTVNAVNNVQLSLDRTL